MLPFTAINGVLKDKRVGQSENGLQRLEHNDRKGILILFQTFLAIPQMCRSIKTLTKGFGNKVILLILILNLKWQKCAVGKLRACLHGVGDPGLVG